VSDFWTGGDGRQTRYRRALKRTARQVIVICGTCLLFAVALALVR
jgi:hypothetical protein